MIILDLIQNIALLVSLAAIYQILGYRIKQKNLGYHILSGLLFGCVGVIGMLTPLHLLPGIIIDGRSVILSVAGLFGGPVVALIAALICAGYRLWLGGAGAWVGAAVALEAAAFGVLFYYLRRRQGGSLSALALWVFGLLVHLVMLALLFALPGGAGRAVLGQVGLPILVIYPVATTLVCLLFQDYETRLSDRQALQQSEERFRHISSTISDIAYSCYAGQDGDYTLDWMTGATKRITGYPVDEIIAQGCWRYLVFEDDLALFNKHVTGLAPGSTSTCELRLRHKHGELVWIASFAECVTDQLRPGHFRLYGGLVDITDRKRAEETLRQQNEYLLALQSTTLELLSQLDLSTLLENIVKRAGQLLNTSSGYLDLVDPDTGQLVPRVGLGRLAESLQHQARPGEGIAGFVWQTHRPLVVDDYDNWPGRIDNYRFGLLYSIIGVPLLSGGQVLGVLGLGHEYSTRQKFGPEAIEILNQFARLAALAIKNARLFSTVQQQLAERQRAEAALQETTQTLQAVVQASPLPIQALDREGNLLMWNPAAEQVFGWTAPEVLGRQNPAVPEAKMDESHAMFLQVLAGSGFTGMETLRQKKDGSLLDVSISTAPLEDDQGHIRGVMAVLADITGRKRAEQKIVTALQEKEILLRELYHRTKNNMQVILSMLSLESVRSHNDEIKAAYIEIANRIQAMALVHQKLYQSQNLTQINLQEYLQELADLLLHSFRIAPGKIALHCAIEPVEVLIDTAMPCGLVVTELISNSLKYAFPGEMSGEINLQLSQQGHEIELCCSDNGVGLPPDFDFRHQKTYGLQSIFALVEHQMQGQVSFTTGQGLACHIHFSDTLYASRVEV